MSIFSPTRKFVSRRSVASAAACRPQKCQPPTSVETSEAPAQVPLTASTCGAVTGKGTSPWWKRPWLAGRGMT